MSLRPWHTLSRRTVWKSGRYLRVELHSVELPEGRIIPDWPWVVTPDFANVVAVDLEGRFLCFRQTKYAVAGTSLAPVGGYLEPGESPLSAAQRELREETGYEAGQWTPLGQFAVDANRGAGIAHAFLARQARPVGRPLADDLEDQELLWLERSEVEAALARGEFKVLPWAAAMALALHRLRQETPPA